MPCGYQKASPAIGRFAFGATSSMDTLEQPGQPNIGKIFSFTRVFFISFFYTEHMS